MSQITYILLNIEWQKLRPKLSPASKAKDQICLLFTNKDFKPKLTSGQKGTKACLNLELIAGKEISSRVTFDRKFALKLRRLKRNRSSKDSYRESFESSRKSIETEKGGTMSVKRLARSTR